MRLSYHRHHLVEIPVGCKKHVYYLHVSQHKNGTLTGLLKNQVRGSLTPC